MVHVLAHRRNLERTGLRRAFKLNRPPKGPIESFRDRTYQSKSYWKPTVK